MAVTLFAYVAALRGIRLGGNEAVAVSILTVGLAQLLHIFQSIKQGGAPASANHMSGRRPDWAVFGLCGLTLLVGTFVSLAMELQLNPPPISAWGVIVGVVIAPTIVMGFIELFEARNHGIVCAQKAMPATEAN